MGWRGAAAWTCKREKPSGDLVPRVRDCLERTTSQTTKLHKQTVNHISPLDLGEYKYLRNIGLIIGPLVRKQQCTGRECSHLVGDLERRVSTRDQIRNRSSGLFEHVNAASSRRRCLTYGRRSSEPESHGRMPTNGIASHRGQQGTVPIPQASVGSPIRGKLMDFS